MCPEASAQGSGAPGSGSRRVERLTCVALEGWPSGRRCGTGNAVYGQLYRGFESHPLRHYLGREEFKVLPVGEKGPAARRRAKAAREAYSMYVERAVERANEADGPFSTTGPIGRARRGGSGAL